MESNLMPDPGMGIAAALSVNESLYFDILHAGNIFESYPKRYNISDHIDLSEKAKFIEPEFMQKHLPMFCERYFKILDSISSADNPNIVGSNDLYGICETGNLVNKIENETPDHPDSWDFMSKYLEHFDTHKDVIVLPRSMKIIQLVGIKIEDILKK